MYVWGVRKKKEEPESMILRDLQGTYKSQPSMVRTQVYLTRAQHEFLTREGDKTGAGLAGALRSLIAEKMEIPEDAWTNNPMLEPTVEDPDWKGHEDGAINHDHYVYGGPKKYEKQKGKWVSLPPSNE